MANQLPVVLHLHSSPPAFLPGPSMCETFAILPLTLEKLGCSPDEAIGIILEVPALTHEILDALNARKSLTNGSLFCLISPLRDDPLFRALSQMGQTVRFDPDEFSGSDRSAYAEVEKLLLSFWGAKRYSEALKMRAHRAGLVDSMGMVAHQWRQPINLISMEAINLIIQAEIETTIPSSSVLQSARIISDQAQRMSDILKSVLSLGKTHRARELFCIRNLCENIDTLWKEQLKHSGIRFIIAMPPDGGQIYGYQTDLEEVLINLIANAKDAYASSEGERTIRLDARSDEARFYLSVGDEAGGVPEPLREKIFQPDFSTKSKDEGSGIGLYVARLIVEQEFRGTLDLTVTDKGSIFTVTIPRNDLCSLRFID